MGRWIITLLAFWVVLLALAGSAAFGYLTSSARTTSRTLSWRIASVGVEPQPEDDGSVMNPRVVAPPAPPTAPSEAGAYASEEPTSGLPSLAGYASFDEARDAIDAFLAQTPARIGVRLYQPATGLSYEWNADQPFPLASLAKVAIMAAYLDSLRANEIPLTEDDLYLLDAMIRYSDNDAAEWLWSTLGGGQPVADFLALHGINLILDDDSFAWGDSLASANDMSRLFQLLYDGRLLSSDDTALALSLLEETDPSQRWGASAGLREDSTIFIKDGWYPDDDGGWRLNTGAIIQPSGSPPYTLVILSDGADWEDGIGTLETVASVLNAFPQH